MYKIKTIYEKKIDNMDLIKLKFFILQKKQFKQLKHKSQTGRKYLQNINV